MNQQQDGLRRRELLILTVDSQLSMAFTPRRGEVFVGQINTARLLRLPLLPPLEGLINGWVQLLDMSEGCRSFV